jgi:hypothetical protein
MDNIVSRREVDDEHKNLKALNNQTNIVYALPHNNLGMAYGELYEWEKSLRAFKKAVEKE